MEKELWKCAKQTGKKGKGFVQNFPTCGTGWIEKQPRTTPGVRHIIIGDVRKVTGKQISEWTGIERGKLGCLFGGPPCQGFSTQGKQDIADPRNNLVFEFGRLVCELNPRTMCMENVPGIVNMVTPDGVPVMDELAAILESGSFSGHTAMKRAFEHQAGIKLGRQRMGKEEKKETKKARRKREKATRKASKEPVSEQFDFFLHREVRA